jgi:hypothetical protein
VDSVVCGEAFEPARVWIINGICSLCRGVNRRSLALNVVSLTRVDSEKSLRKEPVSTKNPQEGVEISKTIAKREARCQSASSAGLKAVCGVAEEMC